MTTLTLKTIPTHGRRAWPRAPWTTVLPLAAALTLAPGAARAEFPRDRPAPPFTRKTLEGHPLSLASLRGKVVLLDFWGPG